MMTWLCVLFGTAVLGAGGYGAMKLFGHLALKRDEAERERLAEEWKRRAAERKARHEGTALPPQSGPAADVASEPDGASGAEPPAGR